MRYEFIESPIFSSYLPDYLTDDEYAEIQEYLCDHPAAGDMVRGSGGVRKVRWRRAGSGKSGGVRVCYYAHSRRTNPDVGDLRQKRPWVDSRAHAQIFARGDGTCR